MKKTVRLSVSTATILLFALPAMSQVLYRIEFYGGITAPQDKDFQVTAPQSSVPINMTHEFSVGGRGGIRIGVDNKGHWGQDLDYSYGSYASRIVNHTNSATFAFTPRVHQISWNALWYPGGQSEGKVFPFLTAGVGGVINTLSQTAINEALSPSRVPLLNPSRPEIGQLHSDNIFAFNAGFGARFRVSNRYSFRIDFRDYMSRATRYHIPRVASLSDPRYIPPPLIIPANPLTGEPQRTVILPSVAPKIQVFPVGGVFHQATASIAFVYHF